MDPLTENQVAAAPSATRVATRRRPPKITPKSLEKPKRPTTGFIPRWDDEVAGLCWQIYKKKITVRLHGVRIDGKEHKFNLGQWHGGDDHEMKAIRDRARQIKRDAAAGIDTLAKEAEAAAAAKQEKQAAETSTVNRLIDNYVKRDVRARGLRSADLIERTLNRLIKPAIGTRSIYTLRRSDIVAMLDEIADQNGERMADLTLAFLRAAFSWQERRDDQFKSPTVKGMARLKPKERARQRTLSDEEIRDLWGALEVAKVPATYPAFVRTLLLTAQRRGEVSHMRWEEIERDTWIIPPERSKTGVENLVPLTAPVLTLLGKRRKTGYVFSNGEDRPLTGYSKAKRELDRAIAAIRQRDGRPPMEHFTYHDLRRTARSAMSRAGVPADHAERVLNHALQGVRATYDRHSFASEKRDALERLASLIGRILAGPTDNVVALERG
jgi:integrase